MKPLRGPLRKRESHLWEREASDFYIEPSWVSERLFQYERFAGAVWDPACGSGRIVESARAAHHRVRYSDIIDRGYDPLGRKYTADFMKLDEPIENIVSNPPFGIAQQFASHALGLAIHKVALLLPANWVQGDKRSRWLESTPLRRVWFIAPRPSMPPGHVITAGIKPGNGTTDYCWMVWEQNYRGCAEIRWLRRD